MKLVRYSSVPFWRKRFLVHLEFVFFCQLTRVAATGPAIPLGPGSSDHGPGFANPSDPDMVQLKALVQIVVGCYNALHLPDRVLGQLMHDLIQNSLLDLANCLYQATYRTALGTAPAMMRQVKKGLQAALARAAASLAKLRQRP
jgi:hypothetical protein